MADPEKEVFTLGDRYTLIDEVRLVSGELSKTEGGPLEPHVAIVVKLRNQRKEAMIPLDAAHCDWLIKGLERMKAEKFGKSARPKDPRRPWRK